MTFGELEKEYKKLYNLYSELVIDNIKLFDTVMCRSWNPIEYKDIDGKQVIVSDMPEDGEEVLVSLGDSVCADRFAILPDGSMDFEFVQIEDVNAWMRLPKPYKPKVSET